MIGRYPRWLLLLILVAWIILGPIGMAFESCAAMMMLCDGGPCGAVTALVNTTPTMAAPVSLFDTPSIMAQRPLSVSRSAVEPPPKPVRLPA